MKDKKSFVLYYDYWELIKELPMDERGELFTAIYEYEQYKTIPDFKGELKMLFLTIRRDLDRNAEKYKETCEKNRNNINKRWRKQNEDDEYALPF